MSGQEHPRAAKSEYLDLSVFLKRFGGPATVARPPTNEPAGAVEVGRGEA